MNVASSTERNWLAEIRPAMREVAPSGIVEVFDYGRGRQGLIPLWVGEGDLPTPSFISEAAKASLDNGETFYTAQGGIPDLREAIAAYMTRVYGAAPGGGAFAPKQFFVTIGGMHAIEIATDSSQVPAMKRWSPRPPGRILSARSKARARARSPFGSMRQGAGVLTRRNWPPPSRRRHAPFFSIRPPIRPASSRPARKSRRRSRSHAATTFGSSPTRSTAASLTTASVRPRFTT